MITSEPSAPVRENSPEIYSGVYLISDQIVAVYEQVNAAFDTSSPDPEVAREVWHRCVELRAELLRLLDCEAVADAHVEGQFIAVEGALDLSRDLIGDWERCRAGGLARDSAKWN